MERVTPPTTRHEHWLRRSCPRPGRSCPRPSESATRQRCHRQRSEVDTASGAVMEGMCYAQNISSQYWLEAWQPSGRNNPQNVLTSDPPVNLKLRNTHHKDWDPGEGLQASPQHATLSDLQFLLKGNGRRCDWCGASNPGADQVTLPAASPSPS